VDIDRNTARKIFMIKKKRPDRTRKPNRALGIMLRFLS